MEGTQYTSKFVSGQIITAIRPTSWHQQILVSIVAYDCLPFFIGPRLCPMMTLAQKLLKHVRKI